MSSMEDDISSDDSFAPPRGGTNGARRTSSKSTTFMVDDDHAKRIGTLVVDQERDFVDDVASMRSHIRRMYSRVWTSSRSLSYLDMVVGCCVLFTSIVSPVDVTMSRAASMNAVFLIGLGCNAVFAVDCFVCFNRGFREEKGRNGGRWVRNRRQIISRYLKTWFIVDLAAMCPLDLPFVLGIIDSSDPGLMVRAVSLLRRGVRPPARKRSCSTEAARVESAQAPRIGHRDRQ